VLMGLSFIVCGCILSNYRIREFYAIVSATWCLNAITSINELFGSDTILIGGVPHQSDAEAIRMHFLNPFGLLVWTWLLQSFVMTFIALFVVLEKSSNNEISFRDEIEMRGLLAGVEPTSFPAPSTINPRLALV